VLNLSAPNVAIIALAAIPLLPSRAGSERRTILLRFFMLDLKLSMIENCFVILNQSKTQATLMILFQS
jgi:hypothetical protein